MSVRRPNLRLALLVLLEGLRALLAAGKEKDE